jgi:hypothetical protein
VEIFDEYLRQGEPNKAEKAKVWKTAIGLQQVDCRTYNTLYFKLMANPYFWRR